MTTEREIIYTEAAREKMASTKEYYARELERRILEMRYVPGDDMVEITASDIEHAHRRMTARVPLGSSFYSQMATIYLLAGLGIAITGMACLLTRAEHSSGTPWLEYLTFTGLSLALFAFIMQKMDQSRLKRRALSDAPIERASDVRQGEASNAYLEAIARALRQEIASEVRPSVETQRMLTEELARLAEAIRNLEQHQAGGQRGRPNGR